MLLRIEEKNDLIGGIRTAFARIAENFVFISMMLSSKPSISRWIPPNKIIFFLYFIE